MTAQEARKLTTDSLDEALHSAETDKLLDYAYKSIIKNAKSGLFTALINTQGYDNATIKAVQTILTTRDYSVQEPAFLGNIISVSW